MKDKSSPSMPMPMPAQQATHPGGMAPHHAAVATGIAQGMMMAPSNEVGLQGHFANLNENFLVAQPYNPNER